MQTTVGCIAGIHSVLLTITILKECVFPNKKNVQPRYGQITLDLNKRHNKFQQIVSPDADDAGVWIHQDAWFHLGRFDKGFSTDYTLKKSGNGVYAFVIKGAISIDGTLLNERDGFGIHEIDKFTITAGSQDAELLLMEVPMQV